MSLSSLRENTKSLFSLSTDFKDVAERLSTCHNEILLLQEQLNPQKSQHTFYGQFSPPVDQFIFERYFPNLNTKGVFIECGAFDGIVECSCKFFEETMGWTAYNIEPFPAAFENLQRNRPKSKNFNLAMSNRTGTTNFKGVAHPVLGLNFGNSSLSHTEAHLKLLTESGCTFSDIEVKLTTWNAFVEQEGILYVDLFVLDVEGHELSVLEGMHGSRVLPDLICIEVGHLDFNSVRKSLAELGYVYDVSLHVNAFFIHQTKLALFSFRRSAN